VNGVRIVNESLGSSISSPVSSRDPSQQKQNPKSKIQKQNPKSEKPKSNMIQIQSKIHFFL